MQAECIITGVWLVEEPPMNNVVPMGVPGDLFVLGDVYIINVNPNAERQLMDEARAKIIFMNERHWERRSVYVIDKEDATLNQNAIDYIKG
jgi:hypothetical protein